MREALEAALNPPEGPEIPVSEGMLDAGHRAVNQNIPDAWKYFNTDQNRGGLAAAWRAMEKQRRKEESKILGAGYKGPNLDVYIDRCEGLRTTKEEDLGRESATTCSRCLGSGIDPSVFAQTCRSCGGSGKPTNGL